MEVTNTNFSLIVEEFLELLKTCEFYAVDQEMTGITCDDVPDGITLDLGESYAAKRIPACRYTAFQIGIALFHKRTGDQGYFARPFNFYLRGSADVQLSMSAIDFLAANHMNFQKWLCEGIHYCTAKAEAEEMERFFPQKPSNLSEEDQEWVASKLEEIKKWYNGTDEQLKLTEPHRNVVCDIALHHELLASGVEVTVWPRFDCRIPTWKRESTTITRGFDETKDEEDILRRRTAVSRRIGFRTVFKALVESKKPMIGHNYFSDLLFLLNQHEVELPLSLGEFKQHVHSLFGVIVDTKVLARSMPEGMKTFASDALEPLFIELGKRGATDKNLIKVALPMGFESYDKRVVAAGKSTGAHCAAYDAYMTGWAYLQLRAQLTEEHVQKWYNHIAVFGSVFWMGLGENDDIYGNCAPFVVEMPPQANINDLQNAFVRPERAEELKPLLEQKKTDVKVFEKLRELLDFWVKFDGDKLAVVLFNSGVQLTDIMQRLDAAKERFPESQALNSLKVFPFADWKLASKTKGSEIAAKKIRTE